LHQCIAVKLTEAIAQCVNASLWIVQKCFEIALNPFWVQFFFTRRAQIIFDPTAEVLRLFFRLSTLNCFKDFLADTFQLIGNIRYLLGREIIRDSSTFTKVSRLSRSNCCRTAFGAASRS
jgi:hypothetical protein